MSNASSGDEKQTTEKLIQIGCHNDANSSGSQMLVPPEFADLATEYGTYVRVRIMYHNVHLFVPYRKEILLLRCCFF